MTIVKSKLVNQIHKNWPGFLKKDIDKVINIILEEIKQALRRSEGCEIRNFGTFRIRTQKESIRRNPKTGQKVHVGEKKTINFKMSKNMFKKINDGK